MARQFPIDEIMDRTTECVRNYQVPSVTHISHGQHSPLYILISTILSARTKDETTLDASLRLFERVVSCDDLDRLTEVEIARIIYPVGFYRNKARMLKKLCRDLTEKFGGKVPRTIDELLLLPGVGRKTANLVLTLAFDENAICVDTHVHRITNRWGYVSTENPLQTEMALRKKLPKRWWKPINTILVGFGQNICRPISPFCSSCPLADLCPRHGVSRHR